MSTTVRQSPYPRRPAALICAGCGEDIPRTDGAIRSLERFILDRHPALRDCRSGHMHPHCFQTWAHRRRYIRLFNDYQKSIETAECHIRMKPDGAIQTHWRHDQRLSQENNSHTQRWFLAVFTVIHTAVAWVALLVVAFTEEDHMHAHYTASIFEQGTVLVAKVFVWLPIHADQWIRGGDQGDSLPDLALFLLFVINGFLPALATWSLGVLVSRHLNGQRGTSEPLVPRHDAVSAAATR